MLNILMIFANTSTLSICEVHLLFLTIKNIIYCLGVVNILLIFVTAKCSNNYSYV